MSSHAGLPTGAAYPTRDEDGNLLTTEFGLCVYKNHQTVTIQARRMPLAAAGQRPFLHEDTQAPRPPQPYFCAAILGQATVLHGAVQSWACTKNAMCSWSRAHQHRRPPDEPGTAPCESGTPA